MNKKLSPLGALAIGVGAGFIGTGFMTAWQETVARLKRSMTVKHMAGEEDPWEHAPAPARVGRLLVQTVLRRDVPPERIHFFTNAVHWGFGTAMGAAYGLVQGRVSAKPALTGPLFGLGVWAQSYATLVPMGLYKPPWQYPAKSIAKDVSYHLVYGTGTAAGYALLRRVSR
ncbi:MAG: hypothetical protein ACRDON_03875 [Gaiellaceae bacterium]